MIKRLYCQVISVGPIWGYRLLLIVSQLITIPYLISRLGVNEYGFYVIIGVLANFISIFDFGLPSSLQNHFAMCKGRGEDMINQRRDAFVLLSLAVMVMLPLAAAAGIFLVPFLHLDGVAVAGAHGFTASIALAVGCGGMSLLSGYSKLLIGEGRIKLSFVLQSIVLTLATVAIFVSVEVLGIKGSGDVFMVRASVTALAGFICYFFVLRLAPIRLSVIRSNIDILRIAGKFMVFSTVSVSISGIPYKFISGLLNASSVVAYNILERFFGVVLQFAQSPLSGMAPRLTVNMVGRDASAIKRCFGNYVLFALPFLVFFSLFLICFSDVLVLFLGAGKISHISIISIVLYAVLTATNLWIAFFSTTLQAGGRLESLIYFSPLHVGLLVGLSALLVRWFGLEGAIVAMITANVALPCLVLPVALRRAMK